MSPKHAALVAIVFFAALCLFRTVVSGWTPPSAAPETAAVTVGITDFPADNFSYVSWPQQSRGGAWLFENLYTTTPHQPALFNVLFLFTGWIAWLTNAHPLLVLNVLGALAVPVFVLGFNAACRTLGFAAATSFVATCLAFGGGGISWVRRLIVWSGADRILPVGELGPDFVYFDLFPASSAIVYSSHAVSLALIALLTLMIVRCDRAEREPSPGQLARLFAAAVLISWIRPYEPVTLLAVVVLLAAASAVLRLPADVLRRRLLILGALAAAMLPQVAYGLWLSSLPVWGESTRVSFDFDVQGDWASGYLVLWLLAAVGAAALGPRLLGSAFAFPALWSLACATIMLVLDSGVWLSKFAAGASVALALLAAAGIDWLVPRGAPRRIAVPIYAGLAGLGLASPVLVALDYAIDDAPVTVPSSLLRAAEIIRDDAGDSDTPSVLTDCGTGVVLPGLAGFRVYCGHWALSDHNRQKIMLLESRLGFLEEAKAAAAFPGIDSQDLDTRAGELTQQLASGAFDYVLVRSRYRLHDRLSHLDRECTLASADHYLILRTCPDVTAALLEAIGG